MKLKFEIDCDNAAFDDEAGGDLVGECEYLLIEAANKVLLAKERRPGKMSLRDSNGNTVGAIWFEQN